MPSSPLLSCLYLPSPLREQHPSRVISVIPQRHLPSPSTRTERTPCTPLTLLTATERRPYTPPPTERVDLRRPSSGLLSLRNACKLLVSLRINNFYLYILLLSFHTTNFLFVTYCIINNRKRVDRVPQYVAKKTWWEVEAELTRYTYNMREAMLRYVIKPA